MPLTAGINSSPVDAAKYALHRAHFKNRIRASPARFGRTPQKARAHIPYRGDSPEVGKKTGIAIPRVLCDDDGFEPFEEVLKQAESDDNQWMPQYSPWSEKRERRVVMARYEAACETEGFDEDEDEETLSMDTILSGMRTPSSPTPMSRLAISTPMLTEPRTHGLEFLHPRVVEPTAVEKLEAPAMVVT